MKRKEKMLAFLLAAGMAVLAGCGRAENDAGQGKTEETKTQEIPGEDTAAKEAETVGAAPQVQTIPETLDRYDPDSGRWLIHTEYSRAEVSEDGAQALSKAVEAWSQARAGELEALTEQYAAEAAEACAFMEDTGYYAYSIFHSLEPVCVDDRIVSFVERNSEYTGGAHGFYGSTGITFDAQNGTVLEWKDLLRDEEGFCRKAEAYLVEKLSADYAKGLFPDYEETLAQMWESGPNWYLDASGMTFIFNPYELGPYAMGEISVTVPYMETAEYMNESYLPGRLTSCYGAGVYKIPEDGTVCFYGSPLDSQPETLSIRLDGGEEECGPVRVELNGASTETDSFVRLGDAFLVCTQDDRVFLIFDADYASDDFVTFVYEIRDRELCECDCQEGLSLQGGVVNTEKLRLQMHLDVLGTYSGRMDYTIGADGKLVPDGERFQVPQTGDPMRVLVTTMELPVVLEGEATVLSPGSRIRITDTDNAGSAGFLEEESGRTGEIRYIRGDGEGDLWTIFIDGVPDYEYFESLPYAG